MSLLLSFGLNESFAWERKIDSLQTVLQRSKSDTEKVDVLYHLSDIHHDVAKPDEAIGYAKKGLSLAEKISYTYGVNLCLNALGIAYYERGDLDSALYNFEKRLEIVSEINDSSGIATTYDNIAIIKVHHGDNFQALELRTKANHIYTALNDLVSLATGYVWIGNIYKEQNQYSTALDYYLKAFTSVY